MSADGKPGDAVRGGGSGRAAIGSRAAVEPRRAGPAAASGPGARVVIGAVVAAAALAVHPCLTALYGAVPLPGPIARPATAALGSPALHAQETHVLLVTGLGGDPEYAEEFHAWAADLRQAALDGGVAPERIVWLADEPERAPDGAVAGRSTAESVGEALADIAGRSAPGDRVLAVFIGHGTARDGRASINLRGPDPTGRDLAAMLEPLDGRTVAVVSTAPSSGPWVEALAAPDRIVITATKTARERNETRFGAFFSRAFGQEVADLDKDGRTSLLEAFRYARREVERTYTDGNLLMTEHPVLEDDGDGAGSENPGGDGGSLPASPDGEVPEVGSDGLLASRFFLGDRRTVVVAEDGATRGDGRAGVDRRADRLDPAEIDDPELRRLYQARDSLETEVADLRTRRDQMEPDAYERALEALLVELAQTAGAIREREGGGR